MKERAGEGNYVDNKENELSQNGRQVYNVNSLINTQVKSKIHTCIDEFINQDRKR